MDPLDLFQHLRQRCILTHDNIVLLQSMLWHTKRKDLHNKFSKFARERGNIVHFFPATETPENGSEYIKFHIGGTEKLDRNKLEQLRFLVSNAVCVPLEFVIVAGIEATNSILVTFMVPVGYANIILHLDDKYKGYLASEGVDAVWCNGKTRIFSECVCYLEDESIKKDEEIKILSDQKSKLEKEVENLQIEGLQQSKFRRQVVEKLESIQRDSEQRITAITSKLIQEYVGLKYTPDAMSLQSIALKNSLQWFNYILKKMEGMSYDTELIRNLLEANSTVTRLRIKSHHAWIESQQKQRIEQNEEEIELLKYEKSKLAYFLKAGLSSPVLTENEEFLVHTMFSSSFGTPIQSAKITVSFIEKDLEGLNCQVLRQILAEIFTAYEETLTEEEINTLDRINFPSKEDKTKFKNSKLRLLEYLWFDYTKRHGNTEANFQTWMVLILVSIKRMDLYDVWIQKGELIIKALLPEKETDKESRKVPKEMGKMNSKYNSTSNTSLNNDSNRKKEKRTNRRISNLLESRKAQPTIEERLQHVETLLEKIVYGTTINEYSFLGKESGQPAYDFKKLFQSKLIK